MVKVIGLGDNVVDKYEHIRTMYPGGNALNFAAYAKRLGVNSAFLVHWVRCRSRTCSKHNS